MKQTTHRLIAAGLATASLALAGAGLVAQRDAAFAFSPAGKASGEPLLFQSVAQMRWGHGALDWLLPEDQGDRNGRKPERRD